MQDFKQLPEKEKDYDLIGYIRFPKPKPIRSQENPGKVPQWYFGEDGHSPKKFWERFSNFLEKKYIFLVWLFLGSIIFLNIFLTLILVIKYL